MSFSEVSHWRFLREIQYGRRIHRKSLENGYYIKWRVRLLCIVKSTFLLISQLVIALKITKTWFTKVQMPPGGRTAQSNMAAISLYTVYSWMPKCSTALENFKSGTKLANQHGDRYGSKVSKSWFTQLCTPPSGHQTNFPTRGLLKHSEITFSCLSQLPTPWITIEI